MKKRLLRHRSLVVLAAFAFAGTYWGVAQADATTTPTAAPNLGSGIVVTASSAATAYPASNAVAGFANEAWVATLNETNTANNFAWIQFDLGQEQYVGSIAWDSVANPDAASSLSNYVVKISDDGSTWTPVYAHFTPPGQDGPFVVAPIIIGQNARYIRIEATKVGDGTGNAASISDVQIVASPPTTAGAFTCTKTLSTTDDYVDYLAALRGNANGTWTNICFNPGTYTNPVAMENNPQNVRLLAPQGGVTFSASVPWYRIPNLGQSGCTQSDDSACTNHGANNQPYRSLFEIDNGNNIYVQGITFKNTYQFYDGDAADPPAWSPLALWQITNTNSEVSTALDLDYTNNVVLDHDTFTSQGKSPLAMGSSAPVLIIGGSISGYYFELDMEGDNGLYVYGTSLTSNNLHNPGQGDYHPVVWANTSDLTLDNATISTISGRGIFSGPNGAANRLAVVGTTNISGIATGALGAWVEISPGVGNLRVFLTGLYTSLNPFYNDPNENGALGKDSGSSVCSYSGTPLVESCVYPPNGE